MLRYFNHWPWRPQGGVKGGAPPPPPWIIKNNFLLYDITYFFSISGPFCYVFLLIAFSPCRTFFGLAPPPPHTRISAGAHAIGSICINIISIYNYTCALFVLFLYFILYIEIKFCVILLPHLIYQCAQVADNYNIISYRERECM